MDLISLESFKKEIKQVREYFKHIQYVDNLVTTTILETDNGKILESLNTLKDHQISFGRDKKIFEYKASIISLYGLLEKYVEIWIKEYLESLSRLVTNYENIDEKVKNNHFELSLKLINTIMSRDSAKHQHLRKEEILKILNQCITGDKDYQFNTDAFVLLSGNLKHKQVTKLFETINIDLNKSLKNNQILTEYIEDDRQIINIANVNTDNLYNTINELVERRNQIAHGSEISDILNISELESYIQFLEKYCQAIFEILLEEFFKQESIHTFKKIEPEKVIDTFNNKILVFEIEDYTIRVGDILMIETIEGNFLKKPILTIELDKISHQELKIVEKTNIAISVEPKIRKNQTFYISRSA